jgi:hypothetical protein
MHTLLWLENLKGRDHSEDLGIDGRVILDWFLRAKGGKACNEPGVPYKAGNFLIELLLASHEEICTMDFVNDGRGGIQKFPD